MNTILIYSTNHDGKYFGLFGLHVAAFFAVGNDAVIFGLKKKIKNCALTDEYLHIFWTNTRPTI